MVKNFAYIKQFPSMIQKSDNAMEYCLQSSLKCFFKKKKKNNFCFHLNILPWLGSRMIDQISECRAVSPTLEIFNLTPTPAYETCCHYLNTILISCLIYFAGTSRARVEKYLQETNQTLAPLIDTGRWIVFACFRSREEDFSSLFYDVFWSQKIILKFWH